MANAYCSSCGSALTPHALYCGHCGTPAAPGPVEPAPEAWSGAETYVPADQTYAPADQTYVPGEQPYSPGDQTYVPGERDQGWDTAGPVDAAAATGPTYGGAFPAAPPHRRRLSPPLLLAAGALVLAIAAAAVALLVKPGSGSPGHNAAGSTASPSATHRSDAVDPGSGASAARSGAIAGAGSTLVAPHASSAAQDSVPRTTSGLRSAYSSGTPVDPSSYGIGDGDVGFSSPSQNIECLVSTQGTVGLRCTIGTYDFPQPGPDCDNGAVLSINGYGNATYTGCLAGPFSPSSTVLDYGGSISAGEFGCVSRSVGVTCLDLATNTGFTLSKQQFAPVN